jgi:hypothetical protein
MKIDKAKPPALVWHCTRERVTRGLGVQELVPDPSTIYNGTIHTSFSVKGRKGTYWASDCYPTKSDAILACASLLRRAKREVMARYTGAMQRLQEVEDNLKGLK